MTKMRIGGGFLALLLLLCVAGTGKADTVDMATGQNAPACVPPGTWADPANGNRQSLPAMISSLAKRPVVLLGETHDNADHHLWQLQVIAALHGRNPNMVLAFESFPREVQPALDRWIRGELDENAFLVHTRWHDVWRFDSALYMPLFHFARINRIPMIAMNVNRSLISRTGQEGWASIPQAEREGVGEPAPPSKAYLDSLAATYAAHNRTEDTTPTPPAHDDPAFRRFADAQGVWDRAMAERLADVRGAGGRPLVVGIAGRGHMEYGYGIPHQLRDLGIPNPATLLPWDQDRPCEDLKSADNVPVADGVFGLSGFTRGDTDRPRLGVMIVTHEGEGVLVNGVTAGSIAERAGLERDDIIITAAGQKTGTPGALIAIIQAQAPGTWLPLGVQRNGRLLEIIAKFPAPHTATP